MEGWDEEPAGTWYTMDNFLEMRKGNHKAFRFFCEQFLSIVVGETRFKNGMRMKKPVSEIATISDEAMALLIIENHYNVWMRQCELE
jgi:hypothetical protein